MHQRLARVVAALFFGAAAAQPLAGRLAAQAQAPTPASHFGFRMGADRELASAADIEKYFELVASQSDRVRIVDIGRTTGGNRTIAAIVSAPENIRNLDRIRAVNQRLADPRTLSPEEARELATTHKAVLAIGCSIHASEVGATQAANELLFALATSTDPDTLNVLNNVVIVLIPTLNPDGHRLIVDWYKKTRATPFEGEPIPWLYHKYAGHDINRDAFMMNLVESRNLARFFYTEWHPQVFLSLHEMNSYGPRMFVPPIVDPIDPNYDPLIWRTAALLGGAMALEAERDGRTGVVSNALYDYYWPGYEDSAPLGHNTVCLLVEVASVRIATPMTISQSELRAQRGVPAYTPRINAPDPWPGGSWTLRDIVNYDLSAVDGLLHAVAAYRERLVQNFYEMGRRAVDQGTRGGPFAFVIPSDQYDAHSRAALEELLLQGGIEIHRAVEAFSAGGTTFQAGSDLILLAQPYRAYVKTLLERQDYPGRRAESGTAPERPYDVAGWTLPAQMGVDVRTIDRPFEPPVRSRVTSSAVPPAKVLGDRRPVQFVIDTRGNAGAIAINRLLASGAGVTWLSGDLDVDGYTYPAGSIVVPVSKTVQPLVAKIAGELGLRATGVRRKLTAKTSPLAPARLALYKPWVENADEGWTRWLLDRYEFRYKTVSDADVRAGNLKALYDAIVLPSAAPDQIRLGNRPEAVPAEYAGGLGDQGVAALKAFVDAGGTLITLDQAGDFAIAELKLPVRDLAHEAKSDDFYCPGSIVKLDLDPAHPISFGMNPRTAAFFAFSSAYEAGDAAAVRPIARYGQKDLLLSGWLEGESVIAGRPAAVDVRSGAGRVVLLGFPVQYRGQTHATFRLLFNAIFTAH